MKNTGLEKILGRIEDLDSVNLGILVQRLARERKMQETVFNTIQDGVIVIDSDGVVQYANDAALGLIGLKENDIGVTRLWKMVPDLAKSIDLEEVKGKKKSAPVLSREIDLITPSIAWYVSTWYQSMLRLAMMIVAVTSSFCPM